MAKTGIKSHNLSGLKINNRSYHKHMYMERVLLNGLIKNRNSRQMITKIFSPKHLLTGVMQRNCSSKMDLNCTAETGTVLLNSWEEHGTEDRYKRTLPTSL